MVYNFKTEHTQSFHKQKNLKTKAVLAELRSLCLLLAIICCHIYYDVENLGKSLFPIPEVMSSKMDKIYKGVLFFVFALKKRHKQSHLIRSSHSMKCAPQNIYTFNI